MTAANSVP